MSTTCSTSPKRSSSTHVPVLDEIAEQLINGRGFQRISGLPVDRLGADDASWIYWGIGMYLGVPWAQNAKGHLLGDVKDQGKALDDPTARGNEIGGSALGFHSDGSDLVGLLCLDPGVSGGESPISNALLCHNLLAASDPELAGALYEGLPYDFRGSRLRTASPTTACLRSVGRAGVCSFATSRNSFWRRSATSLRPGSPPRRRQR